MKKIILLSAAALLPFFASAATLNNNFTTGTMFPSPGSTINASSTCGTAGSSGSVSFALLQNGNFTPLSNNLSTDSNGAFSGNVTFPSSYPAGSAVLVATCSRTGDTINSQVLTFSAPANISFTLPSYAPTVGGIYNLSGACGNSFGLGSISFTLNSNGVNYTLGNTNLSNTGTFSDNIALPNNINTGIATINAVCSNGTIISSSVTIGTAAVNQFAFSSNPFPGASTGVSGTCTNLNGNQNGTVGFSIIRNGMLTTLSSTGNTTNANGSFNATTFFPSNIGSDPATFVITCPNGSTFSNVIMLGSVEIPAPVILPVTPVGGVAAGSAPKEAFNFLLYGEILFALGLLGLGFTVGKKLYVKK